MSRSSADTPPLTFTYRNHRNETAQRQVRPISCRYGTSEWHPEPDWLLRAYDLDKGEEREFAWGGIVWGAGAESAAAPVAWQWRLIGEGEGGWLTCQDGRVGSFRGFESPRVELRPLYATLPPAATAQPLTPDWHPIASAPRTGRQINAMWMPPGRMALVRWRDGSWWTADHPCGIAPDFWCEAEMGVLSNGGESAEAGAFREFVVWALQTGAWEGCDLDGGAMQDMATELGLLNVEPYDPVKHGESEYGAEPGDDWFTVRPLARLGARASRADEVSEKEIIAAGDAIFAMWRDRWKREDVLMVLEAAARTRRSPSPATTDTTGGQRL